MNEWIIKKHKYNSKLNLAVRQLWVEVNTCWAIIEWFQNRNVMPVFNMNQINWKKEITIKIYI